MQKGISFSCSLLLFAFTQIAINSQDELASVSDLGFTVAPGTRAMVMLSYSEVSCIFAGLLMVL